MCVQPASRWGRRFLYLRGISWFVLCLGKSNPYCEISMGSQSYTTRTLQDTLNPKWNFNCQFFIKDLYQDVLCITMFDRDQFSPDGKCGHLFQERNSFLCLGLHSSSPAVPRACVIASWEMLCKNNTSFLRGSVAFRSKQLWASLIPLLYWTQNYLCETGDTKKLKAEVFLSHCRCPERRC